MSLGIDFKVEFSGFWMPKWSKISSKMGSKSDVNVERRFFKKQCFSEGKTRFFEIQWVEVGSKNGAKIHQNIDAKMEGMSVSIFNGF